jgi:hypothetical protein
LRESASFGRTFAVALRPGRFCALGNMRPRHLCRGLRRSTPATSEPAGPVAEPGVLPEWPGGPSSGSLPSHRGVHPADGRVPRVRLRGEATVALVVRRSASRAAHLPFAQPPEVAFPGVRAALEGGSVAVRALRHRPGALARAVASAVPAGPVVSPAEGASRLEVSPVSPHGFLLEFRCPPPSLRKVTDNLQIPVRDQRHKTCILKRLEGGL